MGSLAKTPCSGKHRGVTRSVIPGATAGGGKGIQGLTNTIHGPWIPFLSLPLTSKACEDTAGDDGARIFACLLTAKTFPSC